MNTITAACCTLEPQGAGHASEMFGVLSDPAIYEFENEPPVSEEALRRRFRRLETRASDDGRQVWLNWVLRMPDGRLAGYVQATVLRDGRSFIAYVLHSAYWRRGIGSSAVAAMLEELAAAHGVELAIAVLKARNHRSEALLRKLGFERASPDDEARYRDSDDEVAYVKPLAGAPRTA